MNTIIVSAQTYHLIKICIITITIPSQTCQLIFHSFSLTTAAYTLKFVKDAMKIGRDAKAAQFDFKVIHQHYFWSSVTYTTLLCTQVAICGLFFGNFGHLSKSRSTTMTTSTWLSTGRSTRLSRSSSSSNADSPPMRCRCNPGVRVPNTLALSLSGKKLSTSF